ncbi:MAG: CrcB family protein [Thermoleophilia bacterium]
MDVDAPPLRPSARAVVAAVAVGGAAGAVARVALAETVPFDGSWPWATFAANLAGSLVLGVLAGLLPPARRASHVGWPLLATGLCGGLTTFSTFQLELVELGRDERVGLAAGYAAASLAAGVALALAGVGLARRLRP